MAENIIGTMSRSVAGVPLTTPIGKQPYLKNSFGGLLIIFDTYLGAHGQRIAMSKT